MCSFIARLFIITISFIQKLKNQFVYLWLHVRLSNNKTKRIKNLFLISLMYMHLIFREQHTDFCQMIYFIKAFAYHVVMCANVLFVSFKKGYETLKNQNKSNVFRILLKKQNLKKYD